MSRTRRGFTLIEVAVAAALLALLAAATVPVFVDYLDMRDAETTAKTLASIATGIASYETSVKTTTAAGTNTYPHKISMLANTIATTDSNSCGTAYGGTATNLVTSFNAAFPYVSFYIPAGGYQTPVGQVQDILTRVPATATVGRIEIVMPSIDSMDALRLERYIDGDDGSVTANRSGGTFRINSVSGNRMNVSYVVPAAAKC